jgi:hypothetical protein
VRLGCVRLGISTTACVCIYMARVGGGGGSSWIGGWVGGGGALLVITTVSHTLLAK